jgi:hypothetical protein
VQKNLGYPPLTKIDPNTAQVTENDKTPDEDKFSQAAIPAVLTALHEFVQSDEGAAEVLQGEDPATDWIHQLFDEKRKEAVQTIAAYATQSKEDPMAKMNAIANEAIKVVKENIAADATTKEVKAFFETQIGDILLYLLPGLHMGQLLQNNTLDDTTKKMEGPVSSLMKNIGGAFSTPVTDEETIPH